MLNYLLTILVSHTALTGGFYDLALFLRYLRRSLIRLKLTKTPALPGFFWLYEIGESASGALAKVWKSFAESLAQAWPCSRAWRCFSSRSNAR
jgi:hypothetical protein